MKEELRSRATLVTAYRDDIIAISVLILFTGVALWLRFVYDNWLSDPDIFTMFLPWFGYVGDRIRNADVPVWMPNYLSGMPMVGNPSSGWMYLPVMLIFPFLQVMNAYKMLVLVQLVIGGGGTYALSRRIGMGPTAALAGTMVFVLGPFLYASTRFMVIIGQTNTWIPVGILAAEMALRARRMSSVLGWSALIAVALTQIFAAWPSQGILYSAAWIGGWMLFRTVFDPIDPASALRDRLIRAVICGGASAALFASFGAAIVLPLLDISAQSSIPGGDYSNVLGGDYTAAPHDLRTAIYYLTSDNFAIRSDGVGGAVVVLAALGLVFARRRLGAPFFAFVFVVGASLSVGGSPTTALLNLIPGFEHIHGHRPIAILWVLSLAPAMLVGAAIQRLLESRGRPFSLLPIVAVMAGAIIAAGAISSMLSWIGWWPILTMVATIWLFALPSLELPGLVARWRAAPRQIVVASLVAAVFVVVAFASSVWTWNGWWLFGAVAAWLLVYAFPSLKVPAFADRWRPEVTRVAAAGLIGVMFLFPTGVDIARTVANPETPPGGYTKQLGKDAPTDWAVDTVMAREDPGTAAEFLQTQQQLVAPFRYTGYSGQGYPTDEYTWVYNTFWWRRMEPGIVGILMNGRTLRLGLEQTSGYNPVQFKTYVDYIDAMNGARQDYHWTDTYAEALFGSQLLDMLNVRYVVVDAASPRAREDFRIISSRYNEVYRDDLAIVFENPRVFPRAWMVHVVRPNNDGDGLELLADGSVDGRFVAFVDGPLPTVAVPPEQSRQASVPGEQVVITGRTPESMTLEATAVTDGLLVISASYADGWNAYVDGKRVDILRTNHALQGVPLPAGKHTVELKYEPRSLTIGLPVAGAASAAMIGIWSWALVDFRQRTTNGPSSQRPVRRRGIRSVRSRIKRGSRPASPN